MPDPTEPPSSEITPESSYLSRRSLLQGGAIAATVAATTFIYSQLNREPSRGGGSAARPNSPPLATLATVPTTAPANAGFTVNEPWTSQQDVTHYNNFYEFSTDKEGVADAAAGFQTAGWTLAVGGLVRKPMVFNLDDLMKVSSPEQRVYRMRCVEAWSMVIPWAGFSLSKLLEKVEPLSSAKFVAFESLHDPSRMPGQKAEVLNWPYVEGLRMDEAMHPLAILATGLYGHELPPQDGAPVRLVTPWKYGFKGIKSIVKINLVADMPRTTWSEAGPSEYGFFANVNPNVDHPRWSQANEQRIGGSRQPTLMFNGYGEQVASLYKGMDLRVNF